VCLRKIVQPIIIRSQRSTGDLQPIAVVLTTFNFAFISQLKNFTLKKIFHKYDKALIIMDRN